MVPMAVEKCSQDELTTSLVSRCLIHREKHVTDKSVNLLGYFVGSSTASLIETVSVIALAKQIILFFM